MARLLPSLSDDSASESATPRVIGIDSDDADETLAALSSRTARRILAALHEEPASASEVAESVETSLQNVQYHLGRLADAGVVNVVETVYSEKGREMKVYAPSDRPLVVVASSDAEEDGLRAALGRLLGGVALLAITSVIVQLLLGASNSAADAGATTEASVRAADVTTTAAASGLPPGAVFFLGGLAVLLAGFAVWYVRRR